MLLLNQNAKILGQGITGSEGSMAATWMKRYGTNLVAGVTPKKGGQEMDGIPIFDSVAEAVQKFDGIDAAVEYVPPLFVRSACVEAIDAGVKLVLIVSEKVPTKDEAYIYAYAQKKDAQIIGPSSVGLICPKRKIKLGSIGGATPNRVFPAGNIAIVSKSGGMCSEIGLHLKNHGLGVSWAVGIGGDRIIGTDYVDFLQSLEKDVNTQASVIFGELGGTYEEKLAEAVRTGRIKKPIVAFIAGEFTLTLPSEVQFGHAGAMIEGERGKPDYKRQVLKEAGVKVAEEFDQIADLVKGAING